MDLTVDVIREKLLSRDDWLIRGILAIWKYQTREEQSKQETVELNGVGFNGVDAPFLSSLAKRYSQCGRLTEKQLTAARRCMVKYAGQLLKIAEGKNDRTC
jgi:hypothetical protein